MTLSRIGSSFTYRSSDGFADYTFDVVHDGSGRVFIKNVSTVRGPVGDFQVGIPKSVTDDINDAIAQVEDLVAQTSVSGGMVSFSGETEVQVSFLEAMSSDNYRVVYSISDQLDVWTTGKTVSGFTINVSSAYTGEIGYDIFV